MKAIAIIAAIVAVTASATADARDGAPARHFAKSEKHCWFGQDDRGYGRWGACDSSWFPTDKQPPRRQTITTYDANLDRADGGGNSGGGGGGGGGNR